MRDSTPRARYEHVISLGSFCSVALEIQRYGLRDGSYPFDWVICGLESVIRQIETGFQDLLENEGLIRDPEHDHIVHDSGTGFALYHDFRADASIEEQLPSVRAKYERRIARFIETATEPTLYIRYLSSHAEYDYLDAHFDDIMTLLRRGNRDSGLLLIGPEELPAQCHGLPIHRVAPDEGDVVARKPARVNPALHRALLFTRYPLLKRAGNYRRYRTWKARHHLTLLSRLRASVRRRLY